MKRFTSVLVSSAVATAFLVPLLAFAVFGGPVCNVPADYATIQAAVNDAGCTTINVAAGTYAEHVAVNRAVVLNGANAGTIGSSTSRVAESIVDGSDTDAAFAITANDVTINGFTVKDGSNGGFFSGIWSQTGTQNSSIVNNIITQNGFGVWAQCGGNCLIQANLFDGNNKPNSPGSGDISADSTTGLVINNNEFKNDTAGNPILMQAVAPGAHTNLVVSNNNFHGNTFTNAYILGVNGGTFSGNTITPASDATGISFSGADANITVTNNIITGGARGVRIEDADYYGSSGGNSNITINRNSVASDSEYGVGNLGGYTGSVDATCNWWGAANGPGTVGPGSGSPVTANVNFATWLTSSNLAGSCNGTTTPPGVTVTIDKFIDGRMATSGSASSSAFPMLETWVATNFSGTDVPFTLSPVGLNTTNAYEAVTAPAFDSGASYTMHEVTSTPVVGASCSDGKPYALVGYSTGDTLAQAASSTPTTTVPNFTGLTGSKFVIVWNKDCTPANLTIVKKTQNGDGTFSFTVASSTSTSTVASITTVGGSGTSSPIQLESGTYNVNELSQIDWALATSSCVYDNQSIGSSTTAGGEVITVDAGDSVTCTFTNTNVQEVKVTIIKNISGVHATAGNASSASFPMVSSWNALNLGGAGSGTFALSTVGFNTPSAYEAVTANMTNGSSYASNENTGTSVVGPNCASGQQFRLVGYTTGNSLALAQGGTPSTTTPAFSNITANKWVIVWNAPCTPPPPPPPPANACATPGTAPAGFTLRNGTTRNDIVTLAPQTMFVGRGGNDIVRAGNGNYIVCTGAGNDLITLGNGSNIINAGNGNNIIKTGNSDQIVTTGSGNDLITTGSGNDTIHAGAGNNIVKSGDGNDSITSGSGNDLINAGAGTDTCSADGGVNTVINCAP